MGGAAGWQETGGQAYGHNDGYDGSKGGRVCGGNARDLAGKKTRERIACEKPQENARGDQTKTVEWPRSVNNRGGVPSS